MNASVHRLSYFPYLSDYVSHRNDRHNHIHIEIFYAGTKPIGVNTFIRIKQQKKEKRTTKKTAIYSLAYVYIKPVVHQINS